MATKNIAITEEAYNLLKSRKRGEDSFTDVIIRTYKKDKLRLKDVAGIGAKYNLGDSLHEYVREARKANKPFEERMKELWGDDLR